MKINLSKKDIYVLLYASQYFVDAPDEHDLPHYKEDYEHWQKLKNRLLNARDEMEKGK